ncbi:MAG: isoleucine--tRNA ligase [Candidatus Omnitrophica bacterium]|nr:isoleucine--tRNA ligase [Candidatus Omnitrophota bacterium]
MSNKVDYKNTLNLPKTEFSMKANLPQKEPEFLKFWEEKDIYSKIRQQAKDRPKYILHDGPPYANGDIHLGHALNKTLKDIVVRFYSLRKKDSPFIPGWDCHGLPVEHQLFKELGITKYEIDQVEFRKKAREYALRYVDIQKEEFKRLGILADFEHPYLTLDPCYEAEIIRSFARLLEKGFIYKGVKPVNWCISCETALAEAEVEYAPHTSPSIFVKFEIANKGKFNFSEKASFLVWTTTPWTLIANVAVAVSPDLEYCLVKTDKGVLVIAESRITVIAEKFKLGNYSVMEKVMGSDLEGVELLHPLFERTSKVILADFVSKDEGTGCVHIAPGHGEEDYKAGRKYKLGVLMPVDNKGLFTKEAGKFAGLEVFAANSKIIKELKDKAVLLGEELLEHSYPHCWRCKRPVIFRATAQWFINVDHKNLRSKAKEVAGQIKWFPSIGENRIMGMLETRPDWCLSRQRYWGVPIPVFYCRDCEEPLLDTKIIEYVAELVKKAGSNVWFEKKEVELLPLNTKCKKCNGENFRKETDIVDVWFESGVSHQAVLKEDEGLSFPADLYLEGSDQHRGWFQSSLLTSVGMKGVAPFKAVLTHGFVVDGEGRKMSKSLGNVISPQDIINKFGADVLRLWTISSDFGDDIKVSEEIIDRVCDVYRKWRNTAKFILGNLYDFDPNRDKVSYGDLLEIDKWALAKAENLLNESLISYETFDFHKIYRLIYHFCLIDMSAVYLDILKDRLYTFGASSLERRSAQTVIYEILNVLLALWLPLMPFTAEEIWKYMPKEDKYKGVISVHMFELRDVNRQWFDDSLLKEWELLLKIRDIVMRAIEKIRTDKIIGDSLESEVIFYVSDEKLYRYLMKYKSELAAIFLVSEARIEKIDKIPPDSFRDEDMVPGFGVEVYRAKGSKCPRCWNYSSSVGSDDEYPGLCPRCASVLRNG